jgi:membrane protein implicated in regulation of membrane protease activity
MAPQHHDWSVPAPLRTLLWWPPVAFVVAMIDPSAAAGTIAATGAVLAVLGVLGAAVGRRLSRGSHTESQTSRTLALAAEPVTAAGVLPAEQRAA